MQAFMEGCSAMFGTKCEHVCDLSRASYGKARFSYFSVMILFIYLFSIYLFIYFIYLLSRHRM